MSPKKFWICPKCACVNAFPVETGKSIKDVCDGCGLLTEVVLLLPASFVQFDSEEKLDAWISLMRKMGGKVWRKK